MDKEFWRVEMLGRECVLWSGKEVVGSWGCKGWVGE